MHAFCLTWRVHRCVLVPFMGSLPNSCCVCVPRSPPTSTEAPKVMTSGSKVSGNPSWYVPGAHRMHTQRRMHGEAIHISTIAPFYRCALTRHRCRSSSVVRHNPHRSQSMRQQHLSGQKPRATDMDVVRGPCATMCMDRAGCLQQPPPPPDPFRACAAFRMRCWRRPLRTSP